MEDGPWLSLGRDDGQAKFLFEFWQGRMTPGLASLTSINFNLKGLLLTISKLVLETKDVLLFVLCIFVRSF